MRALELRIPPGALALIFVLAMWLAARAWPSFAVAIPWSATLAAACAAAGVVVALAGVAAFRRARTTVNPLTPSSSSAIVTDSVYRYSRNPMYVGFLLLLIAWAVYLSHLAAFALVPAFVAYMNRYQIEPEERALGVKFGAAYADYCARVRRWI